VSLERDIDIAPPKNLTGLVAFTSAILGVFIASLGEVNMSLAEMMPALQSLPRDDKLEVIRLLVSDLKRQEGIDLLQSGASYPIWTPLDAYDAATSLQQLLDQERAER
jgi:hypothetical protein